MFLVIPSLFLTVTVLTSLKNRKVFMSSTLSSFFPSTYIILSPFSNPNSSTTGDGFSPIGIDSEGKMVLPHINIIII